MARGRLRRMGGIGVAGLVVALSVAVHVRPVAAQAKDETCLACHGQKGMKSVAGNDIFVDPAKHGASVHGSLTCDTCHTDIKEFPHPQKIAKVECATCHSDEAAQLPNSIHGTVLDEKACASCHGNPHEIDRPSAVSTRLCASCHGDEVRDFQTSIHAFARKAGDKEAATCTSCHGPAHTILSAGNPASPVAKKNLPDTCGSCHANADFLARHEIPFAHPVEAYRLSVHGRALAAGNAAAPSCSDCHSNHAVLPPQDPRSKINHWNVPATCGACHTAIKNTYDQSIHGQAVARGVRDAPVCTDCHGEHNILAPSESKSPVNPGHVSSVTCGRCHSDQRLIQRYNLPANRVPTYEDSYHGLAAQAGSQTVANCASCHGVHNIFSSSDPRSTVNPKNLAKTCGACHAGAGQSFAIGPVHVVPASKNANPVVRWIRLTYLVLIPLTLAFMLLHNLLDFVAKVVRGSHLPHSGQELERMSFHFRVAHWLVVLSFPTLVITGFALKFPDAWWVQPFLRWEARFPALRGTVHRIAAVVLLASLAYHFIHLIRSKRDRIILPSMAPKIRDVHDLWHVVRYNFGFTDQPPEFGKFNYAEKIEYLAFVWGSVVMALSGFLLWFNSFTLRHFPKWVADAATAVHYYEAILATLSILIWHFYMTIFDPNVYPMDKSWLTGRTSADHLRQTRPAYYLELLYQRTQRMQMLRAKARERRKAAESATNEQKPGVEAPPSDTPQDS